MMISQRKNIKMKKKLIFVISLIVMMLINVSPAHATNNPRNLYDVKSRDYLWKIANTYGTSVEDLKLINGLQSDLILIGQRLRVPIMYEVVPGDSSMEAFTSI